ncbi:hypothetical protein [Brevibacterium sp. CFH 10365]|uniref:hypothetical protein n=1 Tax=Brevibacterium sp. CFH 10365 TaxID=2585207 RepID=UPI00126620A1|nr:hypothetical protein [Brevibacterium sp. CFH 10365]
MRVRHRRALRGSLAAAAATFVALTSHILGGGALPTAMGVIVPLALSSLVCVLLAGRRLSLPRLTISVGVSQALFHLLFSLFTPTGSAAAGGLTGLLGSHSAHSTASHSVGYGAAGAHAMHSAPNVHPSPDGTMAAGHAMHSHASPAMLVAHCIAGIVTIAMIYWAERLPVMLGEFARLIIRAAIPRLVVLRPLIAGPRRQIGVEPVVPRSLGVLRSPVLRRGPPQPAF